MNGVKCGNRQHVGASTWHWLPQRHWRRPRCREPTRHQSTQGLPAKSAEMTRLTPKGRGGAGPSLLQHSTADLRATQTRVRRRVRRWLAALVALLIVAGCQHSAKSRTNLYSVHYSVSVTGGGRADRIAIQWAEPDRIVELTIPIDAAPWTHAVELTNRQRQEVVLNVYLLVGFDLSQDRKPTRLACDIDVNGTVTKLSGGLSCRNRIELPLPG